RLLAFAIERLEQHFGIERVKPELDLDQHRDDSNSLRREQWPTSQALHHEKGPAQDGRIDAGQEHARRRIAKPGDSVLDGAFGEDTSPRMLGAEDSENQRDRKGVRGMAQTEREDPSVIAARNRRGLFGVP